MRSPASDYVTLVEVFELTRPFEEFEAAVQAATQRLETEGIQELVMVQFYAKPDSSEAGALLSFADRSMVIQHMNMISDWEEFRQLTSTIKPIDVRVYGQLSVEAAAWVQQFIVVSKTFEEHVAGFVRA